MKKVRRILGFLIIFLGIIYYSPAQDINKKILKGQISIFVKPKLLMAGDKEMGSKVLYPSPTLFDIDSDGKKEIIIGGLSGLLRFCKKTNNGWGKEIFLKAKDGKKLRFENW